MVTKTIAWTSGTTESLPSDFASLVKLEVIGAANFSGGAYAVQPNISGLVAGQVISIHPGVGGGTKGKRSAPGTADTYVTIGGVVVVFAPGGDSQTGGSASSCFPTLNASSGGSSAEGGGGAGGPNGDGGNGQGGPGGDGDDGEGGAGGSGGNGKGQAGGKGQEWTDINGVKYGSGGGGGEGGTGSSNPNDQGFPPDPGFGGGNGGNYGGGGGLGGAGGTNQYAIGGPGPNGTNGGGLIVLTYISTAVSSTLTSIVPLGGPLSGGTSVILNGVNFVSGATVAFGVHAATSVIVVSPDEIVCVSPAGAAGNINVTVTTPGGTSNSETFTYINAPTITSVSPPSGPQTGNTSLTIVGTNFTPDSTVTVSGSPANSVVVVSPTQITCTTPSGPSGAAPVVVTADGGNSNSGSFNFTNVTGPVISSLSPSMGPSNGGTPVTITGVNFLSGSTVHFGGVLVSSVMVSPTKITFVTPASTSLSVGVVVNTTKGTSNTVPFSYFSSLLPTISSVSPTSGALAGGTLITIMGNNFVDGTVVSFGGVDATDVQVVSSTEITCTTPPGVAGGVAVLITTSVGTSSPLWFVFTPGTSPLIVDPTISANVSLSLAAAAASIALQSSSADPTPDWQFVQGTDNLDGAASIVLTLDNLVVVGDMIVGGVGFFDPAATSPLLPSSIIDDQENDYLVIIGSVCSTGGPVGYYSQVMFWLPNIENGPTEITINYSSTDPTSCAIWAAAGEYSGGGVVTLAGAGGQSIDSPGTGTDAATSGLFTTTGSNNLVVGFTIPGLQATEAVAGTNFVLDFNDQSNNLYMEHLVQLSAGSIAATFTYLSAESSFVNGAAFTAQPPVAPLVSALMSLTSALGTLSVGTAALSGATTPPANYVGMNPGNAPGGQPITGINPDGTFNYGGSASPFSLPPDEGTAGQTIESNGDGTSSWGGGGTTATPPTTQSFLTPGSGTYTTPAGVAWIEIKGPAGGAGGVGSGSSAGTAPGPGGDTIFGPFTAHGGAVGTWLSGLGGLGGTSAGTSGPAGVGGAGSPAASTGFSGTVGGDGGSSSLGGSGAGGTFNQSDIASAGTAGAPNTGGGGGGAAATGATIPGPGGGAGYTLDEIIVNPAPTYSYTVGAGGTAGAAGPSGVPGGAGGSGGLWIIEHYGS